MREKYKKSRNKVTRNLGRSMERICQKLYRKSAKLCLALQSIVTSRRSNILFNLDKMLRYSRGPTRPMADFHIAQSQLAGPRTVELLARIRPSGRILDASRVVLGGSEIIQVDFHLTQIIPNPRFNNWRIRYQIWPRDINLRRNQTTSSWSDVEALVAGRDVEILDAQGAIIPPAEFLELLASMDPPNVGSSRWAVTIADNDGLQLQLQGLPASAPHLSSKPQLRK